METENLPNFGHCTQRICQRFAPRFGISDVQAIGMGSAFGSGMGHAETCGCVTAALLVLGLRYGPDTFENDEKMTSILPKQVALFEQRFLEKRNSLLCKKILDADISDPEVMAAVAAKGLFASICGPMVAETCAILEDMLKTASPSV